MSQTDRYGLPVSSSSAVGVERYQDGMDKLLAYGLDAERSFAEAIAADEGLALAHAGACAPRVLPGRRRARRRAAIARARELVGRRDPARAAARRGAVGADRRARPRAASRSSTSTWRSSRATRSSSTRPAARIGFGGRAGSRGVPPGLPRAPRSGLRGRLVVSLGARLHVSRDRAASTSPAACPSARSSSIRAMPMRATTSPTSASRPSTTTAAWHSSTAWLAGYDRRAPFHCHLAWHLAMFELHRGNPRARSTSTSATSWAGHNARLAVMDGTALLWRFGLFDCRESPLPWRAARRPRQAGLAPRLRLRRHPRGIGLRGVRRRSGAGEADRQPDGPRRQGSSVAGTRRACP